MMIKRRRKYLFFVAGLIACFFSFSCSYAQAPVLQATVDKNKILIGEQFKLKIEATFPAEDYNVHWLTVPDSMQHFEVIDKSKVDSDYIDEKHFHVSQTLTLTSFDSGQWATPQLVINFVRVKTDSAFNLFTDSLPITVSYSPSDSTNQLRDIKPIKTVDTSRPLWQWIVGGAIVLLLIIGLIWYFKNRNKIKPAKSSSSNLSPYDEALIELNALIKMELSTAEEIKLFHSKLGQVFKTYLTRKYNSDYQSKTTSDILVSLNNAVLDKGIHSELAAALRSGDAVKFAKYLPPAEENRNCLLTIKKAIEILNKENL